MWVRASDGASYTAGPPPVRPDGKPGPAAGPKARAAAANPAAVPGTTPGSTSDSLGTTDFAGTTGFAGTAGSGSESGEAPLILSGPDGQVVRAGDLMQVSVDTGTGTRLTVSADAGEVRRTVDQTRAALLVGALAVLLLAAAGPLTGLGTTAVAFAFAFTFAFTFDDMLDAVGGAERRGAGLGLPIARGIARAHGGDLVCCSPGSSSTELPGGGARFRLTLPA